MTDFFKDLIGIVLMVSGFMLGVFGMLFFDLSLIAGVFIGLPAVLGVLILERRNLA